MGKDNEDALIGAAIIFSLMVFFVAVTVLLVYFTPIPDITIN